MTEYFFDEKNMEAVAKLLVKYNAGAIHSLEDAKSKMLGIAKEYDYKVGYVSTYGFVASYYRMADGRSGVRFSVSETLFMDREGNLTI